MSRILRNHAMLLLVTALCLTGCGGGDENGDNGEGEPSNGDTQSSNPTDRDGAQANRGNPAGNQTSSQTTNTGTPVLGDINGSNQTTVGAAAKTFDGRLADWQDVEPTWRTRTRRAATA